MEPSRPAGPLSACRALQLTPSAPPPSRRGHHHPRLWGCSSALTPHKPHWLHWLHWLHWPRRDALGVPEPLTPLQLTPVVSQSPPAHSRDFAESLSSRVLMNPRAPLAPHAPQGRSRRVERSNRVPDHCCSLQWRHVTSPQVTHSRPLQP